MEQPNSLADRVKYLIYVKQLNQSELARKLNVSATAIFKLVNGETTNPTMDLLSRFYHQLNINMHWLATGEGAMETDGPSNKPADGGEFGQQVIDQMQIRIAELKEMLETQRYTIALQRSLLEGKNEGDAVRPLWPNGLTFLEKTVTAELQKTGI